MKTWAKVMSSDQVGLERENAWAAFFASGAQVIGHLGGVVDVILPARPAGLGIVQCKGDLVRATEHLEKGRHLGTIIPVVVGDPPRDAVAHDVAAALVRDGIYVSPETGLPSALVARAVTAVRTFIAEATKAGVRVRLA